MKQLQEAVKIKNRQEKATQIFKLKHKFWRYRIDQGGKFEKGTYTCERRQNSYRILWDNQSITRAQGDKIIVITRYGKGNSDCLSTDVSTAEF